MSKEKWAVYWYEYSSDTYLYGSEIIYHKLDEVEYKNNLNYKKLYNSVFS